MNTTSRLTRLVLCLLLCLASGLVSCASQKTKTGPVEWELSPDAESVYHYLLLEDAKRSRNATVGEYALEELLKEDTTPELIFDAASFYWQQGKLDKAQEALLNGLKLFPGDQDLELMLAQVYLAEKKMDEATTTIRSYLQKNPGDISTRHELSDILVRNQRFRDALEILEYVPKDKRTPAMRFTLAKALIGLERRAEAITILKSLLAADPKLMEAWAELAYAYELEKEYAPAESAYAKILELGETSQELWLRLIELNLKLKRPDKALELVKKGPSELSFSLAAGTLFVDQKYYDHAEKVLQPLLEHEPDNPEVYFYLALLAYEGKKDLKKALELLGKVPEGNKHYVQAVRFRAHLLQELNRPDEALTLARQGRTAFADKKDFWTLEVRLLEDSARYDEAAKVLEEAQANWPDDLEFLFLQGVIAEKRGAKEQALKIMEQIVAKDPDHADALNYIGYTLADDNRDLARAEKLIAKALNLKPDNGFIQDSLAWVFYRQHRLDEAWDMIQKAVTNASDDPIIWEHYGDIALAVNKRKEARVGYQKSLDLKPKSPEQIKTKLEKL